VGHDELRGRLVELLGEDAVLSSRDRLASFESDPTGRFSGLAALAIRPRSASEAAAALRACDELGARVVVQGGHTGQMGGATPRDGEVVLLTSGLTALGELDPASGLIDVGAGVTLAELQAVLRPSGRVFGVDHGARSAATLGGMAATNAGGQWAVRYGTMSAQVLGIELALPNGSVIDRLEAVWKDTAGYDLRHLMVGSEGTLAVITRLRLRTYPAPKQTVLAMLSLDRVGEAVGTLAAIGERLDSIRSAEIMFEPGMRAVCDHLGIAPPFPHVSPAMLLIECVGSGDLITELGIALEEAGFSGPVAVADDTAGREKLWRYREAHNETVRALGVPLKFDVCLPLGAIEPFHDQLLARLDATDSAQTIVYGHLGDGNLHVNVVGVPTSRENAVEEQVLRLAVEHGGTISAEHGIGQAKTAYLHLVRGPADIAAMKGIKGVFDAHGMLGAGRVLPED
jgi:FAD/FMN-containing dehydrogenase